MYYGIYGLRKRCRLHCTENFTPFGCRQDYLHTSSYIMDILREWSIRINPYFRPMDEWVHSCKIKHRPRVVTVVFGSCDGHFFCTGNYFSTNIVTQLGNCIALNFTILQTMLSIMSIVFLKPTKQKKSD